MTGAPVSLWFIEKESGDVLYEWTSQLRQHTASGVGENEGEMVYWPREVLTREFAIDASEVTP